jgi:hypothetical protein
VGLKGILGILAIGKKAAANTPDHRAMPPHQASEGSFVPTLDEARQQLPTG